MPEVEARDCPAGLIEALTEALLAAEIGSYPLENVEVVEYNDYRFAPAELDAETTGGCVLRAEYDWGDTHSSAQVGVTSGSNVDLVEAALEEAGWDTPYTHYTWFSPDEQGDVMVWRVGDAAEAADSFLSFSNWRDFFAEDEVLLVQVPTS